MLCASGNGVRSMAHVVVAALAIAACATAEQYGGGSMPQYGAVDYEQDYHARSPDASAPLDYKYQEEPNDSEKLAKFPEEEDQRPRLQRRPPLEDIDEEQEQLEEKALELEARSGRRRRKRRGRGRRDETKHEQVTPRRRPPLAHRARDGHYFDSIDYTHDGNKYLGNDERRYRETTAKLLRRKPRQRILVPPPPDFLSESTPRKTIEDFEDEDKMSRHDKNLEYLSGEENVRPLQEDRMSPLRPTLPNAGRPRGSGDENEEARDWESVHKSSANYLDYNDYLAMKNVEQIQNKLPTLLRRPTPTTTVQRISKFSAGHVAPWPGRRAGHLNIPMDLLQPQLLTKPIGTSSPSPRTPLDMSNVISTQAVSESYCTIAGSPTLPAATIINDTTAATDPVFPANGSELSNADKSRLSILKKAQMKEAPGRTTKKPGVLLHVTSHVPTVVLVAPATNDPWMRAREVADDAPETLDKVKRLMRQKLVANAKSIRDLADNWDETICDYIDVGMLDSIPYNAGVPRETIALLPGSLLLLLVL